MLKSWTSIWNVGLSMHLRLTWVDIVNRRRWKRLKVTMKSELFFSRIVAWFSKNGIQTTIIPQVHQACKSHPLTMVCVLGLLQSTLKNISISSMSSVSVAMEPCYAFFAFFSSTSCHRHCPKLSRLVWVRSAIYATSRFEKLKMFWTRLSSQPNLPPILSPTPRSSRLLKFPTELASPASLKTSARRIQLSKSACLSTVREANLSSLPYATRWTRSRLLEAMPSSCVDSMFTLMTHS